MKSTTQTRPRKSSRLTRLPERSVSVNDGTTPYVPRASSVASEAAGAVRRANQVAAAPTTSALPAITLARSKAARRRLAISERPVDKRVMESGQQEHDGGADAERTLEPPDATRQRVGGTGANRREDDEREQRQGGADGEQARERPAARAPERERDREPEEEPEEGGADGEGESNAKQVGAPRAGAVQARAKAQRETLPRAEPRPPDTEQPESHHEHERAERPPGSDDDRDRHGLQSLAGQDHGESGDRVDRHLPGDVGEREAKRSRPTGVGHGVCEGAQARRELAGGRGADQPEDDRAHQPQLDPAGPPPERERSALGAEAVAAAEARNVLQFVAVLDGVPVQPLDLAGPRELGKLPPGQRLDLVADLVSGHRRGRSASCRPGLPRGNHGDRGRASPVQECPALHRRSSSPGVDPLHPRSSLHRVD